MAGKRIFLAGLISVLTATGVVPVAHGQAGRAVAMPGAAGGVVRLPHMVPDGQGNQWFIYNNGQLQQQGNMPVYGQAAMLQINGAYPQSRANQGKLDEKTGELILENLSVAGFTVTRRILISKEEGYVRYIDVIRNIGNQEQAANLSLMSNTNFGVQMASMVADPKRREQNIAWVATTHANNRVAVEVYGGKGAKTVPTISYQQGNNSVQAVMSPTIGANKEIALMHFHYLCNTQDAGTKFVMEMNESKILASLPKAIRKLIINFRGGDNFVGDVEILRGELLDVVELRSGDQLKGTLREKSYRLSTFYGAVELPVENVVGLINVGQFRPRQLVITKDGELFGGKLEGEVLSLQLSSGQMMEVPLSQVSRMGYRKRSGEPEEWTFEKPMVMMQTGDRIGVQVPTKEVEARTRYGHLKLRPAVIAGINFDVEEHGVHEIQLTDGSRFAGLIVDEAFEVRLAGTNSEQVVKFPASSVRRLQFAGKVEEPEETQARMELAHEDVLVGSLTGALRLDTAFSTMALNAEEIKRLVHTPGSPTEVQVLLWDETTVSGQLQEAEVTCQLKSGLTIKVPVALVKEYSQPRPQPSGAMIEGIKALVAELNADDWRQRDRAQERLIATGAVVIPTLRQLRAAQPPEAQQRIDLILKQLDKGAGGTSKPDPAGALVPEPPPPVLEVEQIEAEAAEALLLGPMPSPEVFVCPSGPVGG